LKKILIAFLKEEDGLGTVEIILIIAVLVGVALIFRNQLINFVNKVIGKVLPDPDSIQNNKETTNMFLDTNVD
jgi:Flp pilus assembly pilin Flp